MPTVPLFLAFDLLGTFVFALSGAMLAVRRRLDVMGVLVLGVAVGVAGGILRDVLLGATPPASLQDPRYLVAALAAGVVVFFAFNVIERLSKPVMLLDALGLGLFAVAGTHKALTFDMAPLSAILLGTISAVGGGVLRDILVAEVPRVLREDIYAVAALVGAAVYTAVYLSDLPRLPAALVAIALTFAIRVISVRMGWQPPRAPWT